MDRWILWSMPNVTWCDGLDAVREARKRVPFVLRTQDLSGVLPIMGMGLVLAGMIFTLELLSHALMPKRKERAVERQRNLGLFPEDLL